MIFNLSNNHIAVNSEQLIIFSNSLLKRHNSYKLAYPSSNNPHIPNCRNILTYRHLKIWNKLSDDIVKSNSIVSFKTKINSFDFCPTC